MLALGNGTGCRETEELLTELLGKRTERRWPVVRDRERSRRERLFDQSVGPRGMPNNDAMLRSAISIGRRLLDPFSELVKIDPGSLGVGLYQHDVKAKHLRTSLDAVVESCVNYVGVDLNTASPALLRYVSGLNQLTARRLYDHRSANGPFATASNSKKCRASAKQPSFKRPAS